MLQTFVQSVNPGSPSFMAGLYPGDAIVEVNGVNVKYAPVENVVEEIQKGAKSGERLGRRNISKEGIINRMSSTLIWKVWYRGDI